MKEPTPEQPDVLCAPHVNPGTTALPDVFDERTLFDLPAPPRPGIGHGGPAALTPTRSESGR